MRTPPTTGALGTILAVWAHPDDESFVAGGLLAAASDAGSRVVCVTATRGEQGTADPERWPNARLARTRTNELAAAHAVLGVAEHRWLTYRDGSCDRISPGRGMADVAHVIEEVRPDTIVTFGPDGYTGHSDHRAVSSWTSHAWAATRSSARLLWAAVTAGTAARMAELEPVAGAFYPGYPQITDDREVALHLDLRGDLLDRKVTAMRVHATQSQTTAHRLGEDAFRHWWATESFIQVGASPNARPSMEVVSSRLDPVGHRSRPLVGPLVDSLALVPG
jgi:LmbE family N-acetylglucosaminyl deacetylase